MAEFVKVVNKSDLQHGECAVAEIKGRTVAVFNVNGEFYALDNICVHRGGPLNEGYVDCNNMTVQCPWHGYIFSLATGASPQNARAKVEKFEVKVEGDEVKVAVD